MRQPIQFRHAAGVPVPSSEAADTAAPGASAAQPQARDTEPPVSFADDIMPLFMQFQGPMMWRFDLTSYEAVLANASTILDRISSTSSPMPPPPYPPLTAEQIALFQKWIDDGCQP